MDIKELILDLKEALKKGFTSIHIEKHPHPGTPKDFIGGLYEVKSQDGSESEYAIIFTDRVDLKKKKNKHEKTIS